MSYDIYTLECVDCGISIPQGHGKKDICNPCIHLRVMKTPCAYAIYTRSTGFWDLDSAYDDV
jgi:hypothetical protein